MVSVKFSGEQHPQNRMILSQKTKKLLKEICAEPEYYSNLLQKRDLTRAIGSSWYLEQCDCCYYYVMCVYHISYTLTHTCTLNPRHTQTTVPLPSPTAPQQGCNIYRNFVIKISVLCFTVDCSRTMQTVECRSTVEELQ